MTLHSHDVVAGVNKENLAGDGAGERTTWEESCIAHLALLDIAAQWSRYFHLIAKTREASNAARSKRVERSGRNCVDANVVLTQFKGQVAHVTFKGRLGDGHDVILGHDTLARHVGKSHNAAAPPGLHKRFSSLCHGDQGISADI